MLVEEISEKERSEGVSEGVLDSDIFDNLDERRLTWKELSYEGMAISGTGFLLVTLDLLFLEKLVLGM